MQNVYQLFSWSVSLALGFFISRGLDRFLPRRKNPFLRIGLLLLFSFTWQMPTWVGDENPLILLPFFALGVLTCFEGPLVARGAMAGILYPLLISCGMMADTAELPSVLNLGQAYGFAVQLVKLLVWLVIIVLIFRIVPKGERVELSGKLWRLVGLLSLAPLFAQLIFVLYNSRDYVGFGISVSTNIDYALITKMAYTVLPFVALSCVALLYAIATLSQYRCLEQEQQLIQLNRAYYEQLELRQKQVRRLRHDMANHLQTLSGLPSADRDVYLQQLLDSPALQPAVKWSENRVTNAVFAAKAEEMAAEHIRGDLSAPLPELLPISDMDLCAVLANSLDNAIEACRKLPADTRRITCKARVDKGLFLLRVVNPCLHQPRQKAGRLLTTKPDRENHGLGLESIRTVAEKYSGSYSAGMQNGEFELLLYLPLG